jgi:hypothetical protein
MVPVVLPFGGKIGTRLSIPQFSDIRSAGWSASLLSWQNRPSQQLLELFRDFNVAKKPTGRGGISNTLLNGLLCRSTF